MTEHNTNRKALKLVRSDATSRGSARKQRRLAAAITAPEPNRPRLPIHKDTAAIFDTAAWQKRWRGIRPVSDTLGVYVAGCTASMRLANLLGMPVWKTGTARDVGERMRRLNSERYGSLAIRDFAIVDEPGWNDWEPQSSAAIRPIPHHPYGCCLTSSSSRPRTG